MKNLTAFSPADTCITQDRFPVQINYYKKIGQQFWDRKENEDKILILNTQDSYDYTNSN